MSIKTVQKIILFGLMLLLFSVVHMVTRDLKDVLIVNHGLIGSLPLLKNLTIFSTVLAFGLFFWSIESKIYPSSYLAQAASSCYILLVSILAFILL